MDDAEGFEQRVDRVLQAGKACGRQKRKMIVRNRRRGRAVDGRGLDERAGMACSPARKNRKLYEICFHEAETISKEGLIAVDFVVPRIPEVVEQLGEHAPEGLNRNSQSTPASGGATA